ncbi:acyltransferase family protein [Sphingomonas immobilis]|uniref:Acyltransferase n=1 Tax=Sphingomonas immobilis TaxID=3063997 RepID=A0ABT8ZZS9_9SPHN|nr:acyltransferase [Sphingomonas sp. CA1-15]MDO7843086.1 acyltransferase [Sphingomonas sp. CA1-15]
MKTGRSSHFSELDGMRGILAVLVMLMHYGLNTIVVRVSHGEIQRGLWELSVDFFFVLSGFVLARSFARSPPNLGRYAIRRVLRLGPLYLLTLFVTLACGARADGITLIANVLIVQSLIGLDSINFPSWSIPLELFLPALGLVIVTRWQRWPRVAMLATAMLCLTGAIVCSTSLALEHDMRLLRAVFGLGLGFVMFRLVGAHVSMLGGRPVLTGIGFACILLIMLVGSRFPMATVLFPPLVVVTIATGATTRGLMSTAPAQALGRWSYAIYLVHIPVLLLAQQILGEQVVGRNPVFKIVLAGLALGVAWLCHRFVEVPVARLSSSIVASPMRAEAT